MVDFDTFEEIVSEFRDIADFLVIYIEEAHASDQWFYPNGHHNYSIKQHQFLQERLDSAKLLKVSKNYNLAVDPMTNEANRAYGGYPERLYVILDGKVLYQGDQGPLGYKILELKSFLQKYKDSLEL